MFQTLQEIADHFPYWSVDKVRELIERLCKGCNRKSKKDKKDFAPVLMKENFNKTAFDRTRWYAFINEDDFLNNLYDRGNSQINQGVPPDQTRDAPTPIPDTKTDTEKEPPPPSSAPKKLKAPVGREDLRRRFLSEGFTEEEFKEAWERYETSKVKIKSPEDWLLKVLRSIALNASSQRFVGLAEKHKEEAMLYDGKKWRGENVTACQNRVEFTWGPHYTSVAYDVSDEEWKERTGWK